MYYYLELSAKKGVRWLTLLLKLFSALFLVVIKTGNELEDNILECLVHPHAQQGFRLVNLPVAAWALLAYSHMADDAGLAN